jgi:hypothetical protein
MMISTWLAANANQELCDIAGDMAYDALAGYYAARDLYCPISVQDCKDAAAGIAFLARDGWDYPADDKNDPTGEIAKIVLARLGFQVRAGTIGYDAVLEQAAGL